MFGHYNQAEFEKFKTHSIEFRNSSLGAEEYLIKCQKLLDLPLGSEAYSTKKNIENKNLHLEFFDLVQEMLVLLPDVKKQNELNEAFVKLVEGLSKSEAGSKGSGVKWADKTKMASSGSFDGSSFALVNKLQKCAFCEQFFVNFEFNFHQMEYHVKEMGKLSESKVKESLEKDDFPSLKAPQASKTTWSVPVKQSVVEKPKKSEEPTEEFPALGSAFVGAENRFSALPTPSLFSNPSSHLSLVNKKKHRLQK